MSPHDCAAIAVATTDIAKVPKTRQDDKRHNNQ
jgi:hypothetical protein